MKIQKPTWSIMVGESQTQIEVRLPGKIIHTTITRLKATRVKRKLKRKR